MKCVKSILSILLTLTMIFSVAAIPGFAATETSIKGEDTIYLPGEDAVKLTYTLLDADGNAVEEGVTYSVTSEDENQKKWLEVNSETGEVFVKGDATGKTFTVKAESALYTATKTVSTSETVLSADFEDGQIPSWIYNDTVTVSVKDNGEGKYLNVPCKGSWATTYPTIRLAEQGINFVSDHMTYEMNYMISHKDAGTGTHPSIPVGIKWSGAITEDETITNTEWAMAVNGGAYDATKKERPLYVTGAWKDGNRIKADSNKYNVGGPVAIDPTWYDESTCTFNEGFEYDTLKLEFKGGAVNVTAGGTTTAYTKYKDLGMTFANAAVYSMNLSGAIDDLCIYTGERVEHEFDVVIVPKASLEGDDVLYLPGTGAIKVNYNLVDPDGADVEDYVLYSVTSDDENQKDWLDVNQNTGEVYVKGDAKGKTFTVTGTSADWSASKTVTISDTVLYADFEDGEIPSWIYSDKMAISVMNNGNNKYLNVPAAGQWATINAAIRLKEQEMPINTDYLSFETKFLISNKNSGDGAHPHQPFVFKWENPDGIGNGKTTVNNKEWSMPVYSNAYDEATSTKQLYIPGAWNNGGNVVSDSNKNPIGDPIEIKADWYDEATLTFKEGFEFSTFKLELENNTVYTNVNGVKNTYTKYKDLNLDLNGAAFTSIALGGAFDEILIYTGKKVNYTFGIDPSTRSAIEGDCMLYLPGSDAVKLTYNLVDPDGNDVSENVVYSISSDDPNSSEWVEIDPETGVVHVKGDAFGKSFMVAATSSTYSASQIVEISETALKADFEDGQIPSWIYSNNVALSVKNNGGNKYLNVPCAGQWGTINPVLRLKEQGKPVKSTHLSFETKFMVSNKNSGEGPYPHQPFNFVFENENGLVKKDATVQVTNTAWAIPVSTEPYDAVTETKQLFLNGAWTSGTTVKKSDTIKNNIGAPIYVDSDWYSTETSSFNEGFEFASFKLEVEDGIVYTTVNGEKQSYSAYKDNNLDLNKGELVNASISGAFDDMVIYTGERTYYEFGIDPEARGTIEGDSYLYLPGNGAVKLQYGLIAPDGTKVTEGVEYSVYSDDASSSSWLEMDSETGELYIAGNALGKSFIVIAKTDDYYASQLIETSNKVLFASFDDGQIPSWIYNDNGAVSVKDNGANKYIQAPVFGDWANITPTIRIKEAIGSIKTSHLSFESKFMISHMTSGSGAHPHHAFSFNWENADGIGKAGANISNTGWTMPVYSKAPVDSTRQIYIPGAWNKNGTIVSDSNTNDVGNPIKVNEAWYDSTTKSFVSGFEFANFKLELVNNVIYATVDGKKTAYNKYRDLGMELNNAEFTSVSLGGAFDDILIYTGEKVAYAFDEGFEIVGDALISRAPIDKEVVTADVTYTLVSESEIPEDTKWSLLDSYKGVSVSGTGATGVVSVAGDASAGKFTLQATSGDSVLAMMDVQINDKLANWTNDKTRYYANLQNQTTGTAPRPRLVNNYDDYAAVISNQTAYNFSSQAEAEAAGKEYIAYNSIIKEEEDGNKYVSATGYLHWTKEGATGVIQAKATAGSEGYYNILDNAKVVTLEGKFMVESENMARLGRGTWSVLCNPSNSNIGIDIRYGFISKDLAFITLNMNDSSRGAEGKDVMYVPTDEWFDLRVEFDNANSTFDLYINDIKVADDEKHSIPTLYAVFRSGCAFDDIAYYNGSKKASAGTIEEIFNVYKDDALQSEGTRTFTWNEATAEGGASKAAAAVATKDDLEGKGIITVIYDANGKLVGLNLGESTKNAAGMSLAKSISYGAVSEGGYAKIFLWDFESIKPVK